MPIFVEQNGDGVYKTLFKRISSYPVKVTRNEDALPLVHAGEAAYMFDLNTISYLQVSKLLVRVPKSKTLTHFVFWNVQLTLK